MQHANNRVLVKAVIMSQLTITAFLVSVGLGVKQYVVMIRVRSKICATNNDP